MGREKSKPQLSETGRRAALEREARRANALRLNLRKRKAQARERASDAVNDESGTGGSRRPD
jgi:hypothetical protein